MNSLLNIGRVPLYGLSAKVAPPPLAMLSIAMLLGVDAVRIFVLRSLLTGGIEGSPWLHWQGPVVGAALLASVLFPVGLLGWLPRSITSAAGLGCFIGWGSAWLGFGEICVAASGWLVSPTGRRYLRQPVLADHGRTCVACPRAGDGN